MSTPPASAKVDLKDTPPAQGLVLDASAKLLPDPEEQEPQSARTLEYEADRKEKAARELKDSITQNLGNEFTEYRRSSEAQTHSPSAASTSSQVPHTPVSPVQKLKNKAERVVQKIGDLGSKKETPSEEVKPDPKSPTTPKAEDIETPAGPAPRTEDPVLPGDGNKNTAEANKWREKQNEVVLPNAAAMKDDVQTLQSKAVTEAKDGESLHVLNTNDASEAQRIEDLEQQKRQEIIDRIEKARAGLDPRHSFRNASTKTDVSPPTTAAERIEMARAGLDPRHSFRTPKPAPSATHTTVWNAAGLPPAGPPTGPDGNPVEDLRYAVVQVNPKRNATWLEELANDYPGPWRDDVKAVLFILLCLLALPVLFFVAVTLGVHSYRFANFACSMPGVAIISVVGPRAGLPDFCKLSVYAVRSKSRIVLDPLGLDHVLEWPVTYPKVNTLKTSASCLPSIFQPIEEGLKLAPAAQAHVYPVHPLSSRATDRLQALDTVRQNVNQLESRYSIFISGILRWSSWAPQDMKAVARSSQGLKSSLTLLWGPFLNQTTPLGEMKEKLRPPIEELVLDLKKLQQATNDTRFAIANALDFVQLFKEQLTTSTTFFVERCLSTNALGNEKTSSAMVCQDWDPRFIAESLQAVEAQEDGILEAVGVYSEKIWTSAQALGEFYIRTKDALEDVKSARFVDVEFHTLDQLRRFAELFGRRSAESADGLRKLMARGG